MSGQLSAKLPPSRSEPPEGCYNSACPRLKRAHGIPKEAFISRPAEESAQTTCELRAPQSLSLGKTIPAQAVATAVSLDVEDVVTDTHPPQIATVGLPFVMAELRDRSALARAQKVAGTVTETGVHA